MGMNPIEPDWQRILPATPHRWQMGLRPADARAFFAAENRAITAERARWLASGWAEYAALLDHAADALDETARLAAGWEAETLGASISPPIPAADRMQTLLALGRTWEPDFVLMVPDADGVFRLAGGVVCFPSSWAIREKLGQAMEAVHGPVPGLNAALARQIHVFLDRLVPGAAWARENWGLSRDAERNHHPSRPRARLDATISAADVWLRVERQILFKLPSTGAVLFGIRVDVHPFAGLPADARRGLAQAIATMPQAALDYKGLTAARDALLAMCSENP